MSKRCLYLHQKISSQYLDNKFFEGKQVVSFLGESLVADGCVKKLFDKKIECIGEVFGETGRAEAHFILENGYMSSVLSKKGKTRVSMTGSSLSNTFSEILPLFNGIKFNKDRIVFELNNYRFPLDGDLELFNGKVKLDLGSIVIESKTSVFNFLDIFETDKQIVLAEIPPVEIDVINGIVKLENFIVDIDKMWKMPFHGTLDLNQKKERTINSAK